jgi:type IV pilus assembly protein PilA
MSQMKRIPVPTLRTARRQYGRIRFMGAIAVIGIVAAVVLPPYQDYTVRGKLDTGIALTIQARNAVIAAFIKNGPADMSQPVNTGWSPPTATREVASITVARNGGITLLFAPDVLALEINQLHILPMSGGAALDLSDPGSKGKAVEWRCGPALGKTTVPEKYLRPSCPEAGVTGLHWQVWLLWGAVILLVLVVIFGLARKNPSDFTIDLAFVLGLVLIFALFIAVPVLFIVVPVAWMLGMMVWPKVEAIWDRLRLPPIFRAVLAQDTAKALGMLGPGELNLSAVDYKFGTPLRAACCDQPSIEQALAALDFLMRAGADIHAAVPLYIGEGRAGNLIAAVHEHTLIDYGKKARPERDAAVVRRLIELGVDSGLPESTRMFERGIELHQERKMVSEDLRDTAPGRKLISRMPADRDRKSAGADCSGRDSRQRED